MGVVEGARGHSGNARFENPQACRAQYRTPLPRTFRNKAPRTDPNDIFQQLTIRPWRLPEPGKIRIFWRFVFRTARNLVIDERRRQTVRAADLHVELDEHVPRARPLPHDVLCAQAASEALTAAIRAMPERTRRIFVLHQSAGLPQKEVATRLGLAVGTIEDHVARGNLLVLRALTDDKAITPFLGAYAEASARVVSRNIFH